MSKGRRKGGLQAPAPCTGTEQRMKSLPHTRHMMTTQGADRGPREYNNTGEEFGPPFVNASGEEHGRPESSVTRCVYNYEDKYRFCRILPSDTLVFDSHFECANLRMAHRVMTEVDERSTQEYDLILNTDVGCRGHVQWYYFSVSNMEAGQTVRFNIINMTKPESLYSEGMRPVMFSRTAAAAGNGAGWRRCAEGIRYVPTNAVHYQRLGGVMSDGELTGLYTLSFTVRFEASNDVCYLAYSYPYSYTDLDRFLTSLQSKPFVRRTLLCKTLAGNWCDMLTITSPAKDVQRFLNRPAVVLTSRVHPGESNASYVMQGVINFLLSADPRAQELRDRYVFKIVPMLNPDGVVNGNYRASLAGVDLNRMWDNPDLSKHPTIYYTKKMVEDTLQVRPVALICDFHGHSRREGVFMYSCLPERDPTDGADDPWLLHKGDIERRVRLFPEAFETTAPDYFVASNCSYRMHRSKASTMRVVMFRQHAICNAYTLETSLAGARGHHFSQRDLEHIGELFCHSILEFGTRLKEVAPLASTVVRGLTIDTNTPAAGVPSPYGFMPSPTMTGVLDQHPSVGESDSSSSSSPRRLHQDIPCHVARAAAAGGTKLQRLTVTALHTPSAVPTAATPLDLPAPPTASTPPSCPDEPATDEIGCMPATGPPISVRKSKEDVERAPSSHARGRAMRCNGGVIKERRRETLPSRRQGPSSYSPSATARRSRQPTKARQVQAIKVKEVPWVPMMEPRDDQFEKGISPSAGSLREVPSAANNPSSRVLRRTYSAPSSQMKDAQLDMRSRTPQGKSTSHEHMIDLPERPSSSVAASQPFRMPSLPSGNRRIQMTNSRRREGRPESDSGSFKPLDMPGEVEWSQETPREMAPQMAQITSLAEQSRIWNGLIGEGKAMTVSRSRRSTAPTQTNQLPRVMHASVELKLDVVKSRKEIQRRRSIA